VLYKCARWLTDHGVTHVAMEATGIYSMPVYHALLAHRRRSQHRIDYGTEDPAQRPRHPQPAVQTREGTVPRVANYCWSAASIQVSHLQRLAPHPERRPPCSPDGVGLNDPTVVSANALS